MINAYYLLQAGEQTGPFTLYELQDFNLEPDTLVLSPLAADWQDAGNLPELATYFESRGIYAGHSTYASFWWRLLAHIIDSVLIQIISVVFSLALETLSSFVGDYLGFIGTYIQVAGLFGNLIVFIL